MENTKAENKSKLSLFFLCLITFNHGVAQLQKEDVRKKQTQYIFDSDNLEQNVNDISSIYSIMGNYYKGVEKAESSLLDKVFHPEWLMRDTDTPNEATLNVENKQKFINRVNTHGPYPGYASKRDFSMVEMANNNLAYIRINKMPNQNSTGFFLFKLENQWIIMDKLWVNPQKQNTAINHSEISSTIERILYKYHIAVATADKKSLDGLLHENWDIKFIDSQHKLHTLSKHEFIVQLKPNSENTYYNPLFSIDFYHEKLAVIRVDFHSTSITTFLSLIKIDGKWKITGERKTTK